MKIGKLLCALGFHWWPAVRFYSNAGPAVSTGSRGCDPRRRRPEAECHSGVDADR